MKWLIPLAIHLGFVGYVVGTATFDALDEILLTDIMSSYITHEESTCSPDTASSTSFSFEFPGTNIESNWNPDLVGYESDMFQAIMSHNDTEGDRSWEIRIGLNGVIYSHFVKDMYGETLPPQSREDAPWIDDVIQTVAVVGELNQQTVLPQFCEGDTTESCRKMFVHQAGAYQRDEENLNTTDAPFYSATLAKHCQVSDYNSCVLIVCMRCARNVVRLIVFITYLTGQLLYVCFMGSAGTCRDSLHKPYYVY